MTTPTYKVEIAFNAGFSTPAASRTWTDVSSYAAADDVAVQFGRNNEFSTAGPNTLTIGLNNSDGRFTPGRSSSPYYPNVKLFRPIRITATLPDGSTSVRFLGYVTEWPTEWPDGDSTRAVSSLSASSRLSRLGATTQLRSMLENEILAASPIVYYPLTEPEDSTSASNISTTPAASLMIARQGFSSATPNVTFATSTGPAGDGASSPTFDGTGTLGSPLDGSVFASVLAASSFVLTPAPPASARAVWLQTVGGGPTGCWFLPSGHIQSFWGTAVMESPTSYADGHWHHVALVKNGGTVTLYVDGSAVASDTDANSPANYVSLSVGGWQPGNGGTSDFALTGSVAHVAVFSSVLTAQQVADIYALGMAALNETTAPRATRIAGYGGVAAAEVSATGSAIAVGSQDTSGKTVLDVLRDVEATEAGILYDGRDGTLTLAARSVRYGATAAFTLNADTQIIASDFRPIYDLTGVANDVTATGPTSSARYVNQTSIDDNGSVTDSISTLATNVDEPLMLAAWRVNNYAQPLGRIGSLTVNVLAAANAATATAIASATVGTLITVTNMPSQAATSSASFFVEGYTERLSPDDKAGLAWTITFNVSPADPYLNVWTVEDASLGAWTDTPIAL